MTATRFDPPASPLHARGSPPRPIWSQSAGRSNPSRDSEPEFDYLKSVEIEEKINAMRWCKGTMGCKMLLTTNDKTIKLWKVYGKRIKAVSNMNFPSEHGAPAREPRSGGASTSVSGLGFGLPVRIESLRLPQMSACEL